MIHETNTKPKTCVVGRVPVRRGTSSIDLLVAFTLLVTVITTATPLVVRHGRLVKSQRDYRLALDELSNQMERLTALPADQLANAIQQLAPSGFVAERLSGAELVGAMQPADVGTRITLKLSWNAVERRRAPVTLAAWAIQPPSEAANEPEKESP